MTVGDDMGRIWVYDVGEALAIPGQDEWSKFAHTLVDIKQNKIDQVFHSQKPSLFYRMRQIFIM